MALVFPECSVLSIFCCCLSLLGKCSVGSCWCSCEPGIEGNSVAASLYAWLIHHALVLSHWPRYCSCVMHSDRARAEVGDACDLASRFPDAAGVFSLFGLQQLPQAHLTLANWVSTLAPGQLSPDLHAKYAVLSTLAITCTLLMHASWANKRL